MDANFFCDWPSNLCENNETYVSTTECSPPGYEYGAGYARVAVLGSGGFLLPAAAELLIGKVVTFFVIRKGIVFYIGNL